MKQHMQLLSDTWLSLSAELKFSQASFPPVISPVAMPFLSLSSPYYGMKNHLWTGAGKLQSKGKVFIAVYGSGMEILQ